MSADGVYGGECQIGEYSEVAGVVWLEDAGGQCITMAGPLGRGKGTALAAPSRGQSVDRAVKRPKIIALQVHILEDAGPRHRPQHVKGRGGAGIRSARRE